MATVSVTASQNLTVDVSYNANTGKASGLVGVNSSDHNVWVRATLTGGQVAEQTFGPGTTTINFPANLVTVTFDGQGEPVFNGLLKVETKDPA